MVPKPGKHFRVIGRLLHDAAGDQGEEIQDELSNKLFAIHNNNMGRRGLQNLVDDKMTWLPPVLEKARAAWNRLHPNQPFPDLNDPINAEHIQELAEATQRVDRKKVKASMEGKPKEY